VLKHHRNINEFVDRHCDLCSLELSTGKWEAIASVSSWLMAFQSATTQMSTTKGPMLSSTHAIFCGLQEHIHNVLCELPDSAHRIKEGLLSAHEKLSNYYYY
jgi:hypothetical protein